MRSEIVFEALRATNRFALCHLMFKAVRKLHNPGTRIQDTTNDALQRAYISGRWMGKVATIHFRTAVAVIPQNCLDCYLLLTHNPTWRCCHASIRILLQNLQEGIFQHPDVSRIREGQVQVSEMPREQGRATAIPRLCCDLQEELRNTSTSKEHDQMNLKNP